MIKTDYKTKITDKPIFSSTRKRTVLPVIIMVVVAFSIAVWGLWAEIEQQPDNIAKNTSIDEAIQQNDESALPTVNADSDKPTPNNELQEIKLDFQHDKKTDKDNSTDVKRKKAKPKQKQPELAINKSPDKTIWKKSKILAGDSMARLFKRNGLTATDLHAIISLGKTTAVLKKIRPGKYLQYSKNAEQKLQAIRYTIDRLNTLIVSKNSEQWSAHIDTKKVELRQANARGTINSSLFLAGKNAGLTDAMVMELAGIFGWDIDFILDIREGDEFTVIYEEKFVDGEKIGNGNILAAEFINRGKNYQSVRFTDSSGHSEYYTPAGMSMRKAFIRNPVDFSYISSKFNPRRFHPILKRVKAHNGVDYRAPKGTPVKAAGDGKVIASAYSKYNGHHVFVQHGQKYVTKYLHFTKRKVRRGQRVKQGQVIGYVGATGLAQAPHLHYEFLVNGVHRNPRTIKLPDAEPINKKEKQQFLSKTKVLVEQLKTQSHIFDEKLTAAD